LTTGGEGFGDGPPQPASITRPQKSTDREDAFADTTADYRDGRNTLTEWREGG
jgi:hypothetical protein